MIFLFNSKITNLEDFKTCVSSVSDYPWKSVIFHYEADSKLHVEDFLKSKFSHTSLIMENSVNKTQQDWQKTLQKIDTDLVWLCCEHDYNFVDKDYSHLEEVVNYAKGYGTEKLFSISISNWRESLKKCVMHDLGTWDSVQNDHSAPTFFWLTNKDFDSHRIITKGLLEEWFCSGDYNNQIIEKPEDLNNIERYTRPWKVFVSSREICRKITDICEENNFIDENLDKEVRKIRLVKYYLSKLHPTDRCLANPRHEPGIFNRVMKYYGLKQRKRK
tara:strand:- start:152 stop:973 length:822 start_codon:yes stop_codon:yes gene_type:complete